MAAKRGRGACLSWPGLSAVVFLCVLRDSLSLLCSYQTESSHHECTTTDSLFPGKQWECACQPVFCCLEGYWNCDITNGLCYAGVPSGGVDFNVSFVSIATQPESAASEPVNSTQVEIPSEPAESVTIVFVAVALAFCLVATGCVCYLCHFMSVCPMYRDPGPFEERSKRHVFECMEKSGLCDFVECCCGCLTFPCRACSADPETKARRRAKKGKVGDSYDV